MMEIVKPLNENDIDPSLLEKIQFFKGPLGVIPSSVKTMSYHPKIADAFTDLNKAVMECKGKVTPEFKRLIGYVTSFASGCLYCQAHTILGAERFGCKKKKVGRGMELCKLFCVFKCRKSCTGLCFRISICS